MLTLTFGLTLDDRFSPLPATLLGDRYYGIDGFLRFLEQSCGCSRPENQMEYLRVERYRQALLQYLASNPNAFFAASLKQDALATAEAVLAMRDELVGAGVPIADLPDAPARLGVLHDIEKIWQSYNLTNKYLGREDSLSLIIDILPKIELGFDAILLNEPLPLLPPIWQRLFAAIAKKGIPISALPEAHFAAENTQLYAFQTRLARLAAPENEAYHTALNAPADGSIVVVTAQREDTAADFFAKIFTNTPIFRPILLLTAQNRLLEQVMLQEGLPPQGVLSASAARPILQILKLATTFLWQPIDPFKILEFITLPVKPLRDDLAQQLANIMATTPGINSDKWYATVQNYFENLSEKAHNDTNIDVTYIRKQYDFWFERRRYRSDETVPRAEATEVFSFLNKWAIKAFEEGSSKQNSLLTLAAQADRVTELLNALPEREQRLGFLELERIVKAVYASSPISMEESGVGSMPFVYQNANIILKNDEMMWWNFVNNQNNHFFNKWYPAEINFLQKHNYTLESPEQQSKRAAWQQIRPIMRTATQVVFVQPQRINGSETIEHPFLGELKSCFPQWKTMCIDADNPTAHNALIELLGWKALAPSLLEPQPLALTPPILDIGKPINILKNKEIGKLYFTPFRDILQYPHQFVFKNHLQWRKSSILSVVADNTLKGNVAHRLFEMALKETDCLEWSAEQCNTWAAQRLFTLFRQEAAVLLMYGREPERVQFQTSVLRALWTLLQTIHANKWSIFGVEYELNGDLFGLPMAGRADLVLKNEQNEFCIVDLKWSGRTYRLDTLRNGNDLQLVLYSKLLMHQQNRPNEWAQTAFFILANGVFIARNTDAFASAEIPAGQTKDFRAVSDEILAAMSATFEWRKTQFADGKIELRLQEHLAELADLYEQEGVNWLEMLELPTETSKFDDFTGLVRNFN